MSRTCENRGKMSTTHDKDLASIRELMATGELRAAGLRLDKMMNSLAGRPDRGVHLLYAEYLLARGRPFSAERALTPLLSTHSTGRGEQLAAQSVAEQGDFERAKRLAAEAPKKSSGPIDLRLLTILDEQAAAAARVDAHSKIEAELRARPLFDGGDLFTADALERVDARLTELVRAGRAESEGSTETWGYYLGELCRRHAGAVWQWRRRLSESTMTLPCGVEFNPCIWIGWRFNHGEHHLRRFIGVLLMLEGVAFSEAASIVGRDAVSTPAGEYKIQWGRHALSEALELAVHGDVNVLALGLRVDCPFASVQIPIVVDGPAGPEAVLFWNTPEEEDAFRRYLDMLCLSEMARYRWRIETGPDAPPPDIALYQRADGGVRAGLLARRLVKQDPTHNARWFSVIAEVLFEVVLDGTRSSLDVVDASIMEKIRFGGPNRWGKLFDERHPILFMATSYVGEVLRASSGGVWGADRISGEPIGPTSGLEIGDVRFNLGAKILKRFYDGVAESIMPSIEEYEQAAASKRAR